MALHPRPSQPAPRFPHRCSRLIGSRSSVAHASATHDHEARLNRTSAVGSCRRSRWRHSVLPAGGSDLAALQSELRVSDLRRLRPSNTLIAERSTAEYDSHMMSSRGLSTNRPLGPHPARPRCALCPTRDRRNHSRARRRPGHRRSRLPSGPCHPDASIVTADVALWIETWKPAGGSACPTTTSTKPLRSWLDFAAHSAMLEVSGRDGPGSVSG